MIIVTGASGFIGSCLVRKLNDEGFRDIVVVDDFSRHDKNINLNGKYFSKIIERDVFLPWLRKYHLLVEFVFHIGARTDTTEFNSSIFEELNLNYSKSVWNICVEFGIPLVYASSAATYGNGENGYDDTEPDLEKLKPLNPYGISKNDFDKWVMTQENHPFFWAGLKFFNVYGPNEYHKERMASVIFHAFGQIHRSGKMKLFRSHHPDYKDGEQLRDFVYVKDVVDVCYYFMQHRKNSGIYNLGTGKARTFLQLASAVFSSLDKKQEIDFIDTPPDIRDKYQYFTEAKMNKLRNIGYEKNFFSLEEGIRDYVKNFLVPNRLY